MFRGVLRWRLVRWPYYRLVALTNIVRALARWLINHLRLFTKRLLNWIYWRGVGLSNYLKALGRWSYNHVRWLVRATAYRGLYVVNLVAFGARWLAHQLRWQSARRGTRPSLPSKDEHLQPEGNFLVVVHAHHLEVLPSILRELVRLQDDLCEPLPIIVTATAGSKEKVVATCGAFGIDATVIEVPNHGRDILPFLKLATSGRLADARLVLKLHTKLSPHRADGAKWRESLVQGLTHADEVSALLDKARQGHEFIAVPRTHIFGSRDWGRNTARTIELAQQAGITRLPFRFRFPAGSMFWVTSGILDALSDLHLGPEDFEPEPLPLDGATAHAVERLFGVLAAAHGDGVLPMHSLRVNERAS